MTTVFKVDSTYSSINKAKNILDVLKDAQAKVDYIKGLLTSLNANSDYVTTLTVENIVSQLRAHITKVQAAKATHLSLAHTVKAIVFVVKNNLTSGNYLVISPRFGIRVSADSIVDTWYTLAGDYTVSLASNRAQMTSDGDDLVIKRATVSGFGSVYLKSASTIAAFTSGHIVGWSGTSGASTGGTYVSMVKTGSTNLSAYTTATVNSGTNFANMLIKAQYKSKLDGTTKFVSTPSMDKDSTNKTGLAVCYQYDTKNISAYKNGISLNIPPTVDDISPILETDVNIAIAINSVNDGVIEGWMINSSSNSLAAELSQHLNNK